MPAVTPFVCRIPAFAITVDENKHAQINATIPAASLPLTLPFTISDKNDDAWQAMVTTLVICQERQPTPFVVLQVEGASKVVGVTV